MTPFAHVATRWREFLSRPVNVRTMPWVIGLVLVAFAGVLTLAGHLIPSPEAHHPAPLAPPTSPPAAVPAPPTARRETVPAVAPSQALRAGKRVARRFLHGYLAFTYGQLAAERVPFADPVLRAKLAANRPRVPASVRRRRASFVLTTQDGATPDTMGFSGLVNDGTGTSYTVQVTVQPDARGHLRVTAIG